MKCYIVIKNNVTGKEKIQYRKYKCSDGWSDKKEECWKFSLKGAEKKIESLKQEYHINVEKGLIQFSLELIQDKQ